VGGRRAAWLLVALLFLGSRALIVAQPGWLSDTIRYFEVIQGLNAGLPLYRDVAFEYPPLAGIVIAAPAIIAKPATVGEYRRAFALEMMLFDAATFLLVVTFAMGHRYGAAPAGAYVLLSGLLAPLIYDRFDIAVGLLNLLALILYQSSATVGRSLTMPVVVVGFFLKWIPALIAPLLLAFPADQTRARVPTMVLTGAATLLVIAVPSIALFGGDVLAPLTYHQARGIEIESTWASIALLRYLAGTPLTVEGRFGAQHISGEAVDGLVLWTAPVGILALLVVYGVVITAWRRAQRRGGLEPDDLFLGAAAVLLTFLATARVLSPQFFLWLAPIVPFCGLGPGRSNARRVLVLLFAACVGLTAVLFSVLFVPLVRFDPTAVYALVARNVLLLATLAVALWELTRPCGRPSAISIGT
jgi:hypothetical protein